MRERVEDFPRADASVIRWSGLLDTPWALGTPWKGGDLGAEPLAWKLVRESSEFSYRGGAPWATYRVTGSRPEVVGADAVTLAVDFIADHAEVFANPGATWTVTFEFAAEEARFGGLRWWLICPMCSMRRAHLYPFVPGNPWVCRTCLGLTYQSRHATGASSRHGEGAGSVHHAMNRMFAREAVRSRRAFRRSFHRSAVRAHRKSKTP